MRKTAGKRGPRFCSPFNELGRWWMPIGERWFWENCFYDCGDGSRLPFTKLYGSEPEYEAELEKARWRERLRCPRCREAHYGVIRRFTVVGTMLELREHSLERPAAMADQACHHTLDRLMTVAPDTEGLAMESAAAGIPRRWRPASSKDVTGMLLGWLEREPGCFSRSAAGWTCNGCCPAGQVLRQARLNHRFSGRRIEGRANSPHNRRKLGAPAMVKAVVATTIFDLEGYGITAYSGSVRDMVVHSLTLVQGTNATRRNSEPNTRANELDATLRISPSGEATDSPVRNERLTGSLHHHLEPVARLLPWATLARRQPLR
jgi:hypothetical protein